MFLNFLSRKKEPNYKNVSLSMCLKLLDSRNRIKYFKYLIAHSFLSIVEVVAVMSMAFLGLKSLNLISSGSVLREDDFNILLNLFGVQLQFSARQVFLFLGILLLILVLKNVLAIILFRRLAGFLSDLGSLISMRLFKKLIIVSPLQKKNLDKSETSAAITEGVYSGILQVLGQSVLFFSESLLMFFMFLGLLIYKPVITTLLLIVVGSIFIFSFSRIRNSTFVSAKNTSMVDAHSKNLVRESMNFSEVIYFQNRAEFFQEKFSKDLFFRGINFKNLQTSQQSPKYLLDIVFLTAILVFAVSQFFSQSYLKGIEIFAVFLLVSSRMGPALLRAQNSVLTMQRGFGLSFLFFKVNDFLATLTNIRTSDTPKIAHPDNLSLSTFHVRAKNLVLNVPAIYETAHSLDPIDFDFKLGDIIGISGASGVGKTTLLETVSGIREPHSGQILISGRSPSSFLQDFPCSIFYSRQESILFSGSILENITLNQEIGLDLELAVDLLLKSVGLKEKVDSLNLGIHTLISPDAHFFSSGEEQRISIARALYFNAKVIVLDEATNALDSISEQKLLDLLKSISQDRIIFIISHRAEVINQCTEVLNLGEKFS
jgi:ABC-type bacteriocin/lantibiotic exporter with double-glycine peptidase domain